MVCRNEIFSVLLIYKDGLTVCRSLCFCHILIYCSRLLSADVSDSLAGIYCGRKCLHKHKGLPAFNFLDFTVCPYLEFQHAVRQEQFSLAF